MFFSLQTWDPLSVPVRGCWTFRKWVLIYKQTENMKHMLFFSRNGKRWMEVFSRMHSGINRHSFISDHIPQPWVRPCSSRKIQYRDVAYPVPWASVSHMTGRRNSHTEIPWRELISEWHWRKPSLKYAHLWTINTNLEGVPPVYPSDLLSLPLSLPLSSLQIRKQLCKPLHHWFNFLFVNVSLLKIFLNRVIIAGVNCSFCFRKML